MATPVLIALIQSIQTVQLSLSNLIVSIEESQETNAAVDKAFALQALGLMDNITSNVRPQL